MIQLTPGVSHGLPTLAFVMGGVVDAVDENLPGHLVEINNYVALSERIISTLTHPKGDGRSQIFAQRFAWNVFGKSIYQSIN